jgi:DNA-directed RNA polymerase subunit N
MLIPIRCFTCGGLIADKYEEYVKRVKEGEDSYKVLNSLSVNRYCCRRMIVSNLDTIDQIIPYYEALAVRKAEFESEQY